MRSATAHDRLRLRSAKSLFGRCVVLFVSGLIYGFQCQVYADEIPDYAREQRIAEQIEPQIFDGEALWLEANSREFLAIHMLSEDPKGTVIILHGRDVSPEDQNVAGPMRVGLAENNWSTLALQMPVLAKGKKYYDYLPILNFAHGRIEAAINYLRSQGEETIILAGHSCGAHMANHWLNDRGEKMIQGYIAIGLGTTDAGQDLKTPFPIGNMTVPVLDIYGSEEYPRPLAMVPERRALIEQNGNASSAQIKVDGANHYFSGAGEILTERVLEWLDSADF